MNYFSYRVSLYKLNKKRDKIDKVYRKKFKEAKKTGDEEETDFIASVATSELSLIDDEIHYLKTRYLRSVAEKMSLPIPPITEKNKLWEESQNIGKWYLTDKGITELRGLIRKEKKERLEIVSHWATILIGLIGALIGLLSVILR